MHIAKTIRSEFFVHASAMPTVLSALKRSELSKKSMWIRSNESQLFKLIQYATNGFLGLTEAILNYPL